MPKKQVYDQIEKKTKWSHEEMTEMDTEILHLREIMQEGDNIEFYYLEQNDAIVTEQWHGRLYIKFIKRADVMDLELPFELLSRKLRYFWWWKARNNPDAPIVRHKNWRNKKLNLNASRA